MGTVCALIVGVDDFPPPEPRLSGCVKDVQAAEPLPHLDFAEAPAAQAQAARAPIQVMRCEGSGRRRCGGCVRGDRRRMEAHAVGHVSVAEAEIRVGEAE